MSSKTINVLGIAPYEGMKLMMERLAKQRSDINLTVYVGDLNKGVKIVRENISEDYDVIISRGGTAEMISSITDIPLVEISLSVYDIIRAIKLAENYEGHYAIVGYPAITQSAQLLCDLLQYNVDIRTVHNVNEVVNELTDLKNSHHQMVLCDMITNTTAKELGLNSFLITSGDESIEMAFDQAVKLYKSYAKIKENSQLLNQIIASLDDNIIVVDEHRQQAITSIKDDHIEAYTSIIDKELDDSIHIPSRKFVKSIDDISYNITSCSFESNKTNYALFQFEEMHTHGKGTKSGVTYLTKNEVDASFYNSFYSIASPISELKDTLASYSQSDAPIAVFGEMGLGKTTVAKSLYASGNTTHNPFIIIDCNLINEKTWHFLTDHYNSPLTDSNNTIYFRDLQKLSAEQCAALLSSIVDMNVHVRNKLIFSYSTNDRIEDENSIKEFINRLSALSLHIDPLREHLDDLPKMSSLYINTLNLDLSKQIIGFDPEGMKLLKSYHWPQNYSQFKRLVREMATISDAPYISAKTVKSVLAKENISITSLVSSGTQDDHCISYNLSLDSTLNEINEDIVNIFIEQSGGNRSLAAKKLGISRTTLWRYLK